MAPYSLNYVVETRSDPKATTGEAALVRDSRGQWWRVVPSHMRVEGTADTHSYLTDDGRIVGRYGN